MKNESISSLEHGDTWNPESKICDSKLSTMWQGNKARFMKALRSEIKKIDEVDSAAIRNQIDRAYEDLDINSAIKWESRLNDYLQQLHNAVDSVLEAEVQTGSSYRPRRKHPGWLRVLRSRKLNDNKTYRELLDKSTPERVVWDMTKVIDYDPDIDSAYEERGIAQSMLGNQIESLKDLTRAIELRPCEAGYYVNRGIAYAMDDKDEQALSDFATAINLDKDIPQAYYNRGALYCSLGMFIQALYDFSKAINIDPMHAGYYVNRGNVYSDLEEKDLAIDDYTMAICLDDKCAKAYASRGINFIDIGNYSSAISDISRAIELGLSLEGLYAKRAEAYRALGKYAEADQDILWELETEGKGCRG